MIVGSDALRAAKGSALKLFEALYVALKDATAVFRRGQRYKFLLFGLISQRASSVVYGESQKQMGTFHRGGRCDSELLEKIQSNSSLESSRNSLENGASQF